MDTAPSPAAPDDAAPRLSTLLHLAWPVVISRSAQVVVGLADAIMVARLGESSLAAVTTGGFNAFFLFILPMGTVFIVSSFSSQLFGRGDVDAARRYASYGLGLALSAGLVFAGAIPFVDDAVGLLDYAPDVASLMTTYVSIRLLSGVGVVGLEAIGNYYMGLGNTRLPMLAQLLAMVLNVALNWVLIFGHLGAPALGVAGAAWASVAATTLAFLALLTAFLLRFGVPAAPVPASEASPAPRAPWWREAGRMLRFGLPSGLNWFFEFAAFNVFINFVVVQLGTTGLAAMNAVIQVNSVSFMPAFGVASAGAVLTGQALGRGRPDHAEASVGLTLRVNAAWQATVGVIYLLIPAVLLAPFTDPDQPSARFMELGVRMLMLSSAWQLFDAAANSYAEGLRAAGDTTFPLVVRLIIAWVFWVPASLIVVNVLGGDEVAAVLSLVGYFGLLALALAWRWRSGKWRTIALVEGPPPEGVPL